MAPEGHSSSASHVYGMITATCRPNCRKARVSRVRRLSLLTFLISQISPFSLPPIGNCWTCSHPSTRAGIVGHIPSRALELDGRSRKKLRDLIAAAFRTHAHGRVRKLLQPFKAMITTEALIFVEWHVRIQPRRSREAAELIVLVGFQQRQFALPRSSGEGDRLT